MLKTKFYKNLFQSLSYFLVVMILEVITMYIYLSGLSFEKPNYSWVFLVISILLIILYFLIGFYWIFQKVIINEKGIKVVFSNKVLKRCDWEEISSIEVECIYRNPAINVKLHNGKEIHLDERKSIKKAIETYSSIPIQICSHFIEYEEIMKK